MPRPTEHLKENHRVIERMLKVLAAAAERLDKGQELDVSVLERSLDFIRQFADHSHHHKEEDILFPAIEAAGMPRNAGPIGVMLEEHEEGRKGVQQWAEGLEKYRAGDKTAAPAMVRGIRDYVFVLENHIPKEDNILYPMADEMLDEATQAQMLDQFPQMEQERLGGRRDYYLQLVNDLEAELGLK